MSIVKLSRVTLIGCLPDKEQVIDSLQSLGCLHVIPLATGAGAAETSSTSRGHEALRFLLTTPNKFPQVKSSTHFNAAKIEQEAFELRDRIDALTAERDQLLNKISERQPWGNFKPPASEELSGQRLWFYRVPNYQTKQIQTSGLCCQTVGQDNRFDYVAVVAEREPGSDSMPVPALQLDKRSLSEMEQRLEDVELLIEDAQVARSSLTRWCMLLARSMNQLDDQAELKQVQGQTRDAGPVFALQAWIPVERLPELQAFAAQRGLVLEAAAPDPSDTPPTQFRNPEVYAGGEELVSFSHDAQLLAVRSFRVCVFLVRAFLCHDYRRRGLRTADVGGPHFHLEKNGRKRSCPALAIDPGMALRCERCLRRPGRLLFRS